VYQKLVIIDQYLMKIFKKNMTGVLFKITMYVNTG